MFRPFSRGDLSWEQHLRRIEFVGLLGQEESSPVRATIKLSDSFLQKIASPKALSLEFGARFSEPESAVSMRLPDILASLPQDEADTKSLKSAFLFCYSLAVDKFLTNEKQFELHFRNHANPDDGQIAEICDTYKNGRDEQSIKNLNRILVDEPQHYVAYFKLGAIYLCSLDHLNVDLAFHHFKKAAQLSNQYDNEEFASLAYLHCAFVAYLRMEDESCQAHANDALSLWPQNLEGLFLHAKVAAIKKDDTAILTLKKLVEADRNYFIKIDVDRDFDLIREALYQQLYLEKRDEVTDNSSRIKKSYQVVSELESRIVNFPSFREEIHNVLLNEALREQIRVFKRDEELLTSSFNRSTFYDFDDFMTNCRSFDERWGMDVYIAEELRGKMVALLKLEQSQQTVDELKVNFIRIKSWILAFFIFFGLLQIIATFELSREIRVEIHPLVLTAFLILFLAIALAWAPIEQKYGFKFVRALKNLLKKVTENLQRDGNASQNRASSTGLKKMRAWLRKARYGHFRSRAIFLLFVFLLELVIVLLFHDSLLDKWIFLSMFIMALYIALIMHELTRLMQKEKRLRQLTEEVEKKKSALFKTSRNE